MAQPTASPSIHLGFLTVLQEGGSYLGGYLVTNTWGRPVEFRLTSAVQPNRVQQILYAGTLQSFLCAELIGKTLVEKTNIPIQLVVTECEAVHDLRNRIEVPVVLLRGSQSSANPGQGGVEVAGGRNTVLCHPAFAEDAPTVRELLERLGPGFDLAEPFQRIREAIQEARKQGVARAA